jgi:uncharacterized protein (TIGR03437 family)
MLGLKWWVWVAVAAAGPRTGRGQILDTKYLAGKYYVRQVSFGTDTRGDITDPRATTGTITFDGAGKFGYSASSVIGASRNVSGEYSVDSAGFVTMDSLVRAAKVNARVGPEALAGSSTESADGTFDLLIAIPAPAGGAALTGPYWTATLELGATARNTVFHLSPATGGRFADFAVNGHASNLASGVLSTQQVNGATYSLNPDGSGTANFGAPSATALLSDTKTLFVSASGSVILGGSTTAPDILVGVKAMAGTASKASWSGDYWGAGLRWSLTDSAPIAGYSGSVAARGLGFITWSRRYKALGAGAFDFTGVNRYTINADGSGGAELAQVGLGASGFVGAAVDAAAPAAYEIYFGTPMPPVAGTGVFLHPRGVVCTASYAPAGTPVAPGEFVTLFGSNLARSAQQTSAATFPLVLNGVTVAFNGIPAAVYAVAPDRIYTIVPYGLQGPTAKVTVSNLDGTSSVTVPVAASTPGVFSLDQSGAGAGAILHSNFSVVTDQSPARKGEVVAIYLTGLGKVTPAVADGRGGAANPLSRTNIPPGSTCDSNSLCVLIGGKPAEILYAGLAPGLPGVYQINATVPTIAQSGPVPLAVVTPNAVHDQVYVPIQ